MKKFRLNISTLNSIRKETGMDAKDIASDDISSVEANIEKRNGCRIVPAVTMDGLSPRGSVYLMFNRFFTKKEIDHQIDNIRP